MQVKNWEQFPQGELQSSVKVSLEITYVSAKHGPGTV